MQFLASPMRLQENGLMQRTNQASAIIALLHLMARTPQGSWAGCPTFGLRDLFEDSRIRADVARLAMERMNQTLADLSLTEMVVTEVVREISPGREMDTYSISLELTSTSESVRTQVTYEA